MTATLFSLTLAVLVGAADTKADKKSDKPAKPDKAAKTRKPHPYAPSLPELSEEEEKKLDKIIDRFMLYDIGKLRGKEGAQAYREFAKLGPEAIPALLRGINRAAAYDESCPVTVIASKLGKLLAGSTDTKLMQFARDEIGASVTRTRHAGVLQDLRVSCMLRKNALMRAGYGAVKAARLLTTAELLAEAGRERGQRLKQVLFELARRPGDDAINTLGIAATSSESDVQQLARKLLAQNLSRQKPDVIKQKLKDDKPEVRQAAVRAAVSRNLPVGGDVINLLDDDDADVRELAHQVVVRVARGLDYGPAKSASKEERQKAVEQWRTWWSRQGGR